MIDSTTWHANTLVLFCKVTASKIGTNILPFTHCANCSICIIIPRLDSLIELVITNLWSYSHSTLHHNRNNCATSWISYGCSSCFLRKSDSCPRNHIQARSPRRSSFPDAAFNLRYNAPFFIETWWVTHSIALERLAFFTLLLDFTSERRFLGLLESHSES